ncbi:MAG: ferritin-like domain-containing protein [Gammaproteobacteria bacterium]
MAAMSLSLFHRIQACIQVCDPQTKCSLTQQLASDWNTDAVPFIEGMDEPEPIGEAGRPEQPELVAARQVPRRNINTEQGRIVLAHALAHIEFNAINLALDAAYRFRNMPRQYYSDWLKVAAEEAYHFTLLRQYLIDRGQDYGAYPAHNGLWEMAQKTAHDVMVRMALVPRVLEARGLDVTPGLIARLKQAGDEAFVAHLEIIHRDEIGHVAIGSHWFKYVCEQRGLDARATFKQLIQQYMQGSLRGPFDETARLQAGFSQQELADLAALEL